MTDRKDDARRIETLRELDRLEAWCRWARENLSTQANELIKEQTRAVNAELDRFDEANAGRLALAPKWKISGKVRRSRDR